jgi:hypothetical protein
VFSLCRFGHPSPRVFALTQWGFAVNARLDPIDHASKGRSLPILSNDSIELTGTNHESGRLIVEAS